MRTRTALAAFLASVALNLLVPPAPVQAQVRLPALGEAESDEFSIADEKKVGEAIMRQILPDPDVVDDPVLYEYVDTIFQRLHAAARKRGNISDEMEDAFAWRPFLVRDKSFNAFALPGGYVGVHLGLIAAAGSRDEMASVLGHELSHITQRHIARSIAANKHQGVLATAAMLLGIILSAKSNNSDLPMAVITSAQAAQATGQLTFSREMEAEADRFGLEVMTDAGYAPSGMAAMFERLEQASQLNDDDSYPWLRSHPLTIERLAEARLRARQLPPPDPAGSHATEHALMRARARALFGPVGTVVDLDDENLLHAATGVSGSAPAYFYAFVEALEAGGIAAGLPEEATRKLARATMAGAAAQMAASGTEPSELRRQVTSPNGTTEAALKVLMGEGGLEPLLRNAVATVRPGPAPRESSPAAVRSARSSSSA